MKPYLMYIQCRIVYSLHFCFSGFFFLTLLDQMSFYLCAPIGVSFFVELYFFRDKSWDPYVPLALSVQLDNFHLQNVRFSVLNKMARGCWYTPVKCVQVQQHLFHPFIHCTIEFILLLRLICCLLGPIVHRVALLWT